MYVHLAEIHQLPLMGRLPLGLVRLLLQLVVVVVVLVVHRVAQEFYIRLKKRQRSVI